MMALEAVKHITGAGTGLAGRMLIYDGLNGEMRGFAMKRRPDCRSAGRFDRARARVGARNPGRGVLGSVPNREPAMTDAANPLLAQWDTPFGLPPFAVIDDAHFGPALDAALDEGRANVAAIAENPEPPTFANTIEALELADATLDRVAGCSSTSRVGVEPAREALQREFAPKFSAYSSEITNNAKLFARIAELWERREDLGLTEEQMRVLYLTHRSFVRAGAALDGAARERLTEVKSRLAVLGTSFTQNLLADERDWFMELAEADLEGLPDFVVAAARAAGEEKGAGGPVVTLSRSLIVPFLQFSPRRDLREKALKAWAARGANGGETDNREIAAETLALRAERAALLGYEDFAAYKLETEMAGNADRVRELLMAVWEPAKARPMPTPPFWKR
jgi:peptidyl-dipeptidase Dcp